MCTLTGCRQQSAEGPIIGIAWCGNTSSNSYINTQNTLKAAGIKTVMLGQVINPEIPYVDGYITAECLDENLILKQEYASAVRSSSYKGSNVEDIVKGIDGVVFTGGEDICPTLYKNPQPWHGLAGESTYNATRDVSDYMLMDYCIAKDIPVLGICRGSQVLGVVSGATIIQDIQVWLESKGLPYDNNHRAVIDSETRAFASHGADIKKGSLLYEIAGTERLEGCPSWHHQALDDITGTNLEIVSTELSSGVPVVEAEQRTDCKFVLGIQFHPEAVFGPAIEGTSRESEFMDKETAIKLFQRFEDFCR